MLRKRVNQPGDMQRATGRASALASCDALSRLLGLSICYHDYTGGAVAAALGAQRRNHTNTFCSAVKPRMARGENACTRCDIGMVQARLSAGSAPFVKQCHAGVCEMVFPIRAGSQLAGVLFAGPFAWAQSQPLPEGALVQRPVQRPSARVSRELSRLPAIAPARVADMQHVCGLLVAQIELALEQPPDSGARAGYKERIAAFLHTRASDPVRLRDLAQALFLSESRASQLVRTHFGKTFPELVTEQRIAHAERLLAGSHLTAAAVARAVGFDDPSYFHRVFRRRTGRSPLEFRRSAREGVTADEV